MGAILGQMIEWLMALAMLFILATIVTTSVRALILAIQGKSLDLLAPDAKQQTTHEPGRDKAAKTARPRYTAEAAPETGFLANASVVADENRPSQTEESGGLISRLAADFEAKDVFGGEAQASLFAGVPEEYVSRDISE